MPLTGRSVKLLVSQAQHHLSEVTFDFSYYSCYSKMKLCWSLSVQIIHALDEINSPPPRIRFCQRCHWGTNVYKTLENIILICLEFSLIICHEFSNSKYLHLCHTDTHIVLCRIVSRGITNCKSVNELKAQLNFWKSPEAFRQKLATSCASSLSSSSFRPDNKDR